MLSRLRESRPRVAGELARPHAEEALLAGLVTDLGDHGRNDLWTAALGVKGDVESVLLWGADPATGVEHPALADALSAVASGAGRAVVLEAEPDLVVVTSEDVALVDVAIARPGHAAARARRGEPVPTARLTDLSRALAQHGVALEPESLIADYATARLTAVGLQLGQRLSRRPVILGVGGGVADLLRPGRDPLTEWAQSASRVAGEVARAGVAAELRLLTWRELADRLEQAGAPPHAVRRIRSHPSAARRSVLSVGPD